MASVDAILCAYEAIFIDDLQGAHCILEHHPLCPEALLLRAQVFNKQGQGSKALSCALQAIHRNPLNKRAWGLARDLLALLSPPLTDVLEAFVIDLCRQGDFDVQKLSSWLSGELSFLTRTPLDELEQNPLYMEVLQKMVFLGWEWEEWRSRTRASLIELSDNLSNEHLAALSLQFFLGDAMPSTALPELETSSLKGLLLKSCFTPPTQEDFENCCEKDAPLYAQLLERHVHDQGSLPATFSDETLWKFYEKHPYPHWESIDLIEAPFPKHVELSMEFRQSISPLNSCLIAGVGTGHHLLELAFSYPTTQFTGIDLSHTSLQVARRKTREIEKKNKKPLENIQWVQADLCHWAPAQQFDWIECVGVIHHLEDPLQGWKALHALAKEDAVLFGGVYHHHARSLVKRLKVPGLTLQELRKKIAKDPEALPLLNSPDFYSLHGSTDLLFHPREKSYTLEQLFQELDASGWQWMQIHLPTHPELRLTTREALLAFEKEHPEAFNGMILFWAQKRSSR